MNWATPFGHDWYELLKDMGSLIGGATALLAGGIAYWAGRIQAKATRRAADMQIAAERERHDREIETVRRSLAVELRQIIARAYGAHTSLARLIAPGRGQITARMVESSAGVPLPVVYPAVADRIALLDHEATDTLIVYELVEVARDGAERLIRYRTSDDIPTRVVGAVAEAFLQACLYARSPLPRLKTGMADRDAIDDEMIKRIDAAADMWKELKDKSLWPHDPGDP
jgi:hypothetical protein